VVQALLRFQSGVRGAVKLREIIRDDGRFLRLEDVQIDASEVVESIWPSRQQRNKAAALLRSMERDGAVRVQPMSPPTMH
jgi:hypothetical protein